MEKAVSLVGKNTVDLMKGSILFSLDDSGVRIISVTGINGREIL